MIKLELLLLQLKGCLGLNLMTRLRSHPLKYLLDFSLEYLLGISSNLPLSWAGCRLQDTTLR